MRAVDRPSAVKMTALLDPAFPLGIDPASKGVSSAKDGLYAHYKQVLICLPYMSALYVGQGRALCPLQAGADMSA